MLVLMSCITMFQQFIEEQDVKDDTTAPESSDKKKFHKKARMIINSLHLVQKSTKVEVTESNESTIKGSR